VSADSQYAHCPRPRGIRGACSRTLAAFSLIELLVVCALLLILSSMYWGASSSSRQRQLQNSCQQNLQKVYVAMNIYANEHANLFPQVAGARTSEEALDVLVPKYTSDTSVFICPGSKNSPLLPGEALRQSKISYAYYMGRSEKDAAEPLMSDRQVDTQAKTAGQLVFSSTGKAPGNNHHKYGGNLLFGDGRVELSPAHASVALGLTPSVVLLNPK
jgi:type II secretory pathway pseudopilin PulG